MHEEPGGLPHPGYTVHIRDSVCCSVRRPHLPTAVLVTSLSCLAIAGSAKAGEDLEANSRPLNLRRRIMAWA